MTYITVEKICFQKEMSMVLITSIELGTYMKGYRVWNPKLGEELNVQIEPNNFADKFSICTEKIGILLNN